MANCFLKGLCGAQNDLKLKLPVDSAVLAPFVTLTVKSPLEELVASAVGPAASAAIFDALGGAGRRTITVGNKANPAIIKSFQCGLSNGAGVMVEIIDQQGGDFTKIFEKVSHGGTSAVHLMEAQFGYVRNDCAGGGEATLSAKLNFVIRNISIAYSNTSSIHFTVEGTDTMADLYDTKVPSTIGTPAAPVLLTEAIAQLLKTRALQVNFVQMEGDQEGKLLWKMDSGTITSKEEGPKGVWEGKNRNVLQCITEWLRPYVSDKGRGFQVFFDPSTNPPSLVVRPYVGAVCEDRFNSSPFHVGSYIVSGGNCSPVLGFTTNVKWSGAVAFSSGGTQGGANTGAKSAGPAQCLANSDRMPHLYAKDAVNQLLFLGHAVQAVVSRNEVVGRLLNATRKAYEAMYQHSIAQFIYEPIQADLRLQGDPAYTFPRKFFGHYVGLTVINPFQVQNCEWVNEMKCNDVLSNLNWRIDGAFHDIREGTYTTTLRISLATPGYDIPLGAQLGAQ